MLKRWRPYLTVLRLRALMETQYRAAALGGLVTQVFFGLVYIFLYTALFDGSDPQMLRDTITYVWIPQMFFRMMFSSDNELSNLIMSGGVAYMLVRPLDQHRFWVCRDVGGRLVGAAMRMIPMLLVQLILPDGLAAGIGSRCKAKDGARHLRRLVQQEVEGPLSEHLLRSDKKCTKICGILREGQICFQ